MARQKNLRADNTYMIMAGRGVNPKLGAKLMADGRERLFLDFYFGKTKSMNTDTGETMEKADRQREALALYLWAAPRTPDERAHNKETLELAKRIRFEREQQLIADVEGYRLKRQEVNWHDYYQAYINNYSKKDYRCMRLAFKRFRDFLRDTPKYQKYEHFMRPDQLTKDLITDFTEYLKTRSVGEGARTLFARFKKVCIYAVEHEVLRKNPCTGISIKIDEMQLKKDVLSMEEVKQLMATHYTGENPTIRRAFIFSLYSGLRWCDVRDLTFANVDYSNRLLKFEQNKTKGHSANSSVIIPLTDNLIRLIGQPQSPDQRSERVFDLPSYDTSLTTLKRWVKRAGIDKHISWHCARHSFAVNILNNGANVKTVASLLGHSGLRYVEVYTRAVDSLKQAAIESLPAIEL